MKAQIKNNREGSVLAAVLVVMLAVTTLILAMFQQGYHGAREAEFELKKAQAFWLAEAGRQWCIANLNEGGRNDGTSGPLALCDQVGGSFSLVQDPDDATRRLSIGVVNTRGRAVTNAIAMNLAFVASPFEDVVYGGNRKHTDWTLQLRGNGSLVPPVSGAGGSDSLWGDVTVYGNFRMEGSAKVGTPNPNLYEASGDVNASGTIDANTASIAGTAYPNQPREEIPDLSKMNYARNNDYDIAKIFNDLGISSGRLPKGHPLRDVVVKNPSSCAAECSRTPGDDFFFEPSYVGSAGSQSTGVTPLNLGDDKVYYVDGHVWFHNKRTYGFRVDGQATIVSSRDIHISDNLQYKDRGLDGDMLALVALGQYDSLGNYNRDGNIYFGDPEYGTLYTADAFMFANNDFYYNTSANSGKQAVPESGFQVFGNYVAMNQVVVLRDWYNKSTLTNKKTGNKVVKKGWYYYDTVTGKRVSSRYVRNISETFPVVYDLKSGQWHHVSDPTRIVAAADVSHYAMRVAYDERIRDAATRMKGLPEGSGSIFLGMNSWQELSGDQLSRYTKRIHSSSLKAAL